MSGRNALAQALSDSVGGRVLERERAREVFSAALDADTDPVVLGGFLASLATRGEAVSEIAGAVDALREAMTVFEHDAEDAIDTCGTGGDGLGSFNLSTAAAVVAAACGVRVIKHGNRALSSKCGSADLLEAAGVPLELSPRAARAVLDEVGVTFLFAPAYHPALRFAGPVRRALGVRTIFNLLGPLLNPGRVRRQLIGVGEAARTKQLAAVLDELGHERGYVVHGGGGADELTLEGGNVAQPFGDATAERFDPSALGFRAAPVSALAGGDAAHNLELWGRVLDGAAGPLFDAVALNAGAALLVARRAATAAEGCDLAREALRSGAARDKLGRWVEVAQREGARS